MRYIRYIRYIRYPGSVRNAGLVGILGMRLTCTGRILVFTGLFIVGLGIPLHADLEDVSVSFRNLREGWAVSGACDGELKDRQGNVLSWQGGFDAWMGDLLQDPRAAVTLQGTCGLTISPVVTIALGSLDGCVPLGLLLDPLSFPYSSLPGFKVKTADPGVFNKTSTGTTADNEGLVVSFIANSGRCGVYPFILIPLADNQGNWGGGVGTMLQTPVGYLNLGSFFSEPASTSTISCGDDQLFYGGLPFTRGRFIQAAFQSHPQGFSIFEQDDGLFKSSVHVSYGWDPDLGDSLVHGYLLAGRLGVLTSIWECQYVPKNLGRRSRGMETAKTSVYAQQRFTLSSHVRWLEATWYVQEKVWRLDPYANSYQKRKLQTQGTFTVSLPCGSLQMYSRMQMEWDAFGNCGGVHLMGTSLQVEIQEVCVHLASSATCKDGLWSFGADMDLNGLYRGVRWGISININRNSTELDLGVDIPWKNASIHVEVDAMRNLTLALAIHRGG